PQLRQPREVDRHPPRLVANHRGHWALCTRSYAQAILMTSLTSHYPPCLARCFYSVVFCCCAGDGRKGSQRSRCMDMRFTKTMMSCSTIAIEAEISKSNNMGGSFTT